MIVHKTPANVGKTNMHLFGGEFKVSLASQKGPGPKNAKNLGSKRGMTTHTSPAFPEVPREHLHGLFTFSVKHFYR